MHSIEKTIDYASLKSLLSIILKGIIKEISQKHIKNKDQE